MGAGRARAGDPRQAWPSRAAGGLLLLRLGACRRLLQVVGALLLWGLAGRAAGDVRSGSPRLLLVNSCAPGARWGIELAAGVRDGVLAGFPGAVLEVESLSAEPLPAGEAAEHLAARIAARHAQHPIALAIVADDAAFAFALDWHERLLPGLPVVFCGVSDLPPGALSRHPLVTGAVQVRDLSGVLTTALTRHPASRGLFTVHDLSPVGLAYREQVQSWTEELLRRRPGMVVAFLSAGAYSTAELVEQVRMLPAESLVLVTSWSRDREGQPQRLDDVLARIARVSPVPVYGVTGSEGGLAASMSSLQDAYRQGEAAASMAVQVLRGIPPSEIPVRVARSVPELAAGGSLGEPAAVPMVPESPLVSPRVGSAPGATLLWLGCVALLFQAALALLLFSAIRKRVEAERTLDETRRRLGQVVECAGLGLLEWDLRTDAISISPQYAELLGYAAAEVGPSRAEWEALVHPDDLPAVKAAVAALLEDHAAHYSMRYRMRTRSGVYRRVQERGDVVSRAPDGTPTRFIGIQTEVDATDGPPA